MKVLVTGAAGFIGSWSLRELPRHGFDVVGTDKSLADGIIQADITDLQQVKDLVEKIMPDAILHLAAISGSTGKNETEQSLRQPFLNFQVNTLGTLNLCEACRVNGTSKFVYMSTFAVYGRTQKDRLPITERTPTKPEHAYGVSKLIGEEIVRTYSEDFGMKSVIFRAPFIVGEYQKERNVVREFTESAIKGEELLIYGDGTHLREFIHPGDLVNAFAKAVQYGNHDGLAAELFVLGNQPISIKDLANKIVNRAGKGKVNFKQINVDRTFDQYTDRTKSGSVLGWQPNFSIDDIIDRILSTEFSEDKLLRISSLVKDE